MEWEKTNNPSPNYQPMSISPATSTVEINEVAENNQAIGGEEPLKFDGIVKHSPDLSNVGYEHWSTNPSPDNGFDLSLQPLKASDSRIAQLEHWKSEEPLPMEVSYDDKTTESLLTRSNSFPQLDLEELIEQDKTTESLLTRSNSFPQLNLQLKEETSISQPTLSFC